MEWFQISDTEWINLGSVARVRRGADDRVTVYFLDGGHETYIDRANEDQPATRLREHLERQAGGGTR